MAEQKLPVTTATNQQYGMRAAQRASQQAVPMGKSTTSEMPEPKRIKPGSLTPLDAPTGRPNEPITAGANFGAGPNAMAAGIPTNSMGDETLDELRAIFSLYPNTDLALLIDYYERNL
jgi:hypothetical protein